ncbi:MAG: T9SS type A sorting domain-containing protein [Bacteroidota bacterium]
MKTRRFLSSLVLTAVTGMMAFATVPEKTGWWRFDNPSDMLKAEIGSALVLTGSDESVDGPVTGNKAIKVGTGSYLAMEHGITAPVNEYTLQIDFMVPVLDGFNAIFQTTPDNSDDAEFFINGDSKLGAWRFGYTENVVEANTWYRMVVSVKNGEFYRIYVNGSLWLEGVAQEADSRDALQSALLLFADEDGEDKEIHCAEVAIWNVALTGDEVAELGNASAPYVGIMNQVAGNGDLGQAYPNPFSSSASFNYEVRETGAVAFHVYDFAGKEVSVIREGVKTPGSYTMTLSSENLVNGVYLVKMDASGTSSTRRVVVLK